MYGANINKISAESTPKDKLNNRHFFVANLIFLLLP